MLQEEIEEQLQALTKEVEELRAEVETLKEKASDEPTLIPGAEYDFVPTVPDKVIGTFVMRVGKVIREDNSLCLTDDEWQMYSIGDQE